MEILYHIILVVAVVIDLIFVYLRSRTTYVKGMSKDKISFNKIQKNWGIKISPSSDNEYETTISVLTTFYAIGFGNLIYGLLSGLPLPYVILILLLVISILLLVIPFLRCLLSGIFIHFMSRIKRSE